MISSILRGTVVTSSDPLGLERVKVVVPQATGRVAMWADPLQRDAGARPVAGSAVWVLYESGDPALPVYVAGSAWSAWIAVPQEWVASGWNAYTAGYRVGPAGQVEFHGELSTPSADTTTTLANGFSAMAPPAALWPVQSPASCPIVIMPGGPDSSACAVARVTQSLVAVYGGPWSYTGTSYLGLTGLRYNAAY